MRVVIVGAGGHGGEVLAYANDAKRSRSEIEVLGFLDDTREVGCYGKSAILGAIDGFVGATAEYMDGLRYIVAIGDNGDRREVVDRIESIYGRNMAPWSLVATTAWVGDDVAIGAGTLIAPGAIVTSGVALGEHCILNVKASVSHDCILEDFVSVNPGATICGHCHIGSGAMIGAGATVIDRVKIGARSIVGAGAVVVRDVPPDVAVVGVPARVVKVHLNESKNLSNHTSVSRSGRA